MKTQHIIPMLTSVLILCSGCESEKIKKSPTPSKSLLEDQWKEALIIDILSNTPELNIHQMNGQTENKVYVNEDGREAVFDADGNLVTDPTNKGSYNYYDAIKEPLAHFAKDTDPWLKWGNARNDPSAPDQRLKAYLKDLKIGIITAYESRSVEVGKTTVTYNSKTERAVALKFLEIIRKSGDQSLFDMYKNPATISDVKIDQFLSNIEPFFRSEI